MKKTLLFITLLSGIYSVSAQTALYQGGTGWGTSTPGGLLVGTSTTLRYSRLPVGASGTVLMSIPSSPFLMNWVATATLGISGGSGSPSGTQGNVQYNDNGAFGASTTFTYATTTGFLGLGTTTASSPLSLQTTASTFANFVANTTAVATFNMQNLNAANTAETRLGIIDTAGQGIFLSTPSTTNNQSSIFGLTRSTSDFVFNNGGVQRNFGIGTLGSTALVLGTANTSRVFISSAGSVGIGTTTPNAMLAVAGSATTYTVNVSSSTGVSMFNIGNNGSLGISSSSPGSIFTIDASTTAPVFASTTPIFTIRGDQGRSANYFQIMDNLASTKFLVNQFGNTQANGGFIAAATAGTCPHCGSAIASPNAAGNGMSIQEPQGFSGDSFHTVNATSQVVFVIKSNGNTSIGTGTPYAKLNIQNIFGSSTPLFDIASTTGFNSTTSMFRVNPDGGVGLGTTTPVSLLSVIGTGIKDVISFMASATYQALGINLAGQVLVGTSTPSLFGLTVGTSSKFTYGRVPNVFGYTSAASTTLNIIAVTNGGLATTTVIQATSFMNPGGTFKDGDMFEIRALSTTTQNVYFDTLFSSSTDLTMPTTVASGTTRYLFEYDGNRNKLDLVGKLGVFNP